MKKATYTSTLCYQWAKKRSLRWLLLCGILLSSCLNDALKDLSLVQSWSATVLLPISTQKGTNLTFYSGKFAHQTATLLQRNGLNSSSIASVVTQSIQVSFSDTIGFKADSLWGWEVGLLHNAVQLPLGKIDSLASGQGRTVNLFQTGTSFRNELFEADSVQLYFTLSLRDSLAKNFSPAISINYQLRN